MGTFNEAINPLATSQVRLRRRCLVYKTQVAFDICQRGIVSPSNFQFMLYGKEVRIRSVNNFSAYICSQGQRETNVCMSLYFIVLSSMSHNLGTKNEKSKVCRAFLHQLINWLKAFSHRHTQSSTQCKQSHTETLSSADFTFC